MLKTRWEHKDMPKNSDFTVTLTTTEYDQVLDTFKYMLKNFDAPSVIDKAAIMLKKEDLANIIAYLEEFTPETQKTEIPMNFYNWAAYTGLLLYAERALPAGHAALQTIEKLNERNDELDEKGVAPSGP